MKSITSAENALIAASTSTIILIQLVSGGRVSPAPSISDHYLDSTIILETLNRIMFVYKPLPTPKANFVPALSSRTFHNVHDGPGRMGLPVIDCFWRSRGTEGTVICDTQTPVQAIVWALQTFAPNASLVLSICNGTGSALIASLMRGVPCAGIDSNQIMTDSAVSRVFQYEALFKDATGNPMLACDANPSTSNPPADKEPKQDSRAELLERLMSMNNGALVKFEDGEKWVEWEAAIKIAPEGSLRLIRAKYDALKEEADLKGASKLDASAMMSVLNGVTKLVA